MNAVTSTPQWVSACEDDELPINPFIALRVAFGMLLGTADFETLMGNPRGKQMLHSAWLHGHGVVWGFPVTRGGTRELTVGPGLAVDCLGRELHLDADRCLDLDCWLADQMASKDPPVLEYHGCDAEMHACLVARFDTCPTAPVPALADPCDLSRKHNDYSRVVETVSLELVPGPCPSEEESGLYHRVRVLFGLAQPGEHDPAGEEALERARAISSQPAARRPVELLRAFRELAAKDATELAPIDLAEGGILPCDEDLAGIVLADLRLLVQRNRDGTELAGFEIDPFVRPVLVAQRSVQELLCGAATWNVGADGVYGDAGGPRLLPQSVRWPRPDQLELCLTGPVLRASLTARAVAVTSLAHHGWVHEDISDIRYEASANRVTIQLQDPPAHSDVRLVMRGTGPTPIVGEDAPHIPLAGLVGGPAGSINDGHDAVLTISVPNSSRR
jgi:hypothetical protein